MAWRMIDHSCGHSDRIQLYGPQFKRDWRAQYLAEEPCRECQDTARQQDRDREYAEARDAAQAAGWPELIGSEKQVRWAQVIRHKAVDSARRRRYGPTSYVQVSDSWQAHESWQPMYDLVAEAMQEVVRASWWIDHRHTLEQGGVLESVLMALAHPDDNRRDLTVDLLGPPLAAVATDLESAQDPGDTAAVWRTTLRMAFGGIDWEGVWYYQHPRGRMLEGCMKDALTDSRGMIGESA